MRVLLRSVVSTFLIFGSLQAQDDALVSPEVTPLPALPAALEVPVPFDPASGNFAIPVRPATSTPDTPRFEWHSAIKQSAYFLTIQHGFRMLTEPGTRAELKGPFFKDWFASVRGYEGWKDGDPALVNYVGHPMMGSVSGFIQIQNDRDGKAQTFGFTRDYWRSRGRAAMFSAIYSAVFELGPLSEASLGNVGLRPHTSGMVDLVVTPTVGTAWLVAEDIVDRFVIAKVESRIKNRVAKVFLRGVLNPSRSFSSALGGRAPWIRYDRPGVWSRP